MDRMAKKLSKKRAKNLGDSEVEVVVGILDGWIDKLTWAALIDAIETRLHTRYTRQALHQHEGIKLAFQLTKERLSGLPQPQKENDLSRLTPAEAKAIVERLDRLKAENHRLKAVNERLLEQFVVWAYNAHTRGLDIDFLNRALPSVDRDRTRLPAR